MSTARKPLTVEKIENTLANLEKRLALGELVQGEYQQLILDNFDVIHKNKNLKKKFFESYAKLVLETGNLLTALDCNHYKLMDEKVINDLTHAKKFDGDDFNKSFPQAKNIIETFNKLSAFIINDIVNRKDINHFILAVNFWVNVAHYMAFSSDVRNYDFAMAILSGLEKSPIVTVLNRAQEKKISLLSDDVQKKKNQLALLLTSAKSYQVLRAAYRDQVDNDIPHIFYLGNLLTDLTFIQDGNKHQTVEYIEEQVKKIADDTNAVIRSLPDGKKKLDGVSKALREQAYGNEVETVQFANMNEIISKGEEADSIKQKVGKNLGSISAKFTEKLEEQGVKIQKQVVSDEASKLTEAMKNLKKSDKAKYKQVESIIEKSKEFHKVFLRYVKDSKFVGKNNIIANINVAITRKEEDLRNKTPPQELAAFKLNLKAALDAFDNQVAKDLENVYSKLLKEIEQGTNEVDLAIINHINAQLRIEVGGKRFTINQRSNFIAGIKEALNRIDNVEKNATSKASEDAKEKDKQIEKSDVLSDLNTDSDTLSTSTDSSPSASPRLKSKDDKGKEKEKSADKHVGVAKEEATKEKEEANLLSSIGDSSTASSKPSPTPVANGYVALASESDSKFRKAIEEFFEAEYRLHRGMEVIYDVLINAPFSLEEKAELLPLIENLKELKKHPFPLEIGKDKYAALALSPRAQLDVLKALFATEDAFKTSVNYDLLIQFIAEKLPKLNKFLDEIKILKSDVYQAILDKCNLAIGSKKESLSLLTGDFIRGPTNYALKLENIYKMMDDADKKEKEETIRQAEITSKLLSASNEKLVAVRDNSIIRKAVHDILAVLEKLREHVDTKRNNDQLNLINQAIFDVKQVQYTVKDEERIPNTERLLKAATKLETAVYAEKGGRSPFASVLPHDTAGRIMSSFGIVKEMLPKAAKGVDEALKKESQVVNGVNEILKLANEANTQMIDFLKREKEAREAKENKKEVAKELAKESISQSKEGEVSHTSSAAADELVNLPTQHEQRIENIKAANNVLQSLRERADSVPPPSGAPPELPPDDKQKLLQGLTSRMVEEANQCMNKLFLMSSAAGKKLEQVTGKNGSLPIAQAKSMLDDMKKVHNFLEPFLDPKEKRSDIAARLDQLQKTPYVMFDALFSLQVDLFNYAGNKFQDICIPKLMAIDEHSKIQQAHEKLESLSESFENLNSFIRADFDMALSDAWNNLEFDANAGWEFFADDDNDEEELKEDKSRPEVSSSFISFGDPSSLLTSPNHPSKRLDAAKKVLDDPAADLAKAEAKAKEEEALQELINAATNFTQEIKLQRTALANFSFMSDRGRPSLLDRAKNYSSDEALRRVGLSR